MANNLFLVLVFFSCFTYSSYAYQFLVGGRDGWVLHPSESYNHWAERLRFQVNDTLLFKYNPGSDSVLVVNKDDYNGCNINNPIQRFTDGNSVFRFDRSGPFFFISGNKTNCDNGQKLHIIVLAIRNRPVTPTPTAPSPAGGQSPSPAPHGGAPAPTGSSPSPSPVANGPGASSPAANGPGASTPGSGGPGASSPSAGGPGASTPGSGGPGASSPGAGGPNAGNTPADVNSPPPGRSFAAPVFGSGIVYLSAFSIVLSAGLGGFIISF